MSATARRLADPRGLARRLGQADEGLDEGGVVGSESVVAGSRLAARVPRPAPSSGASAQLGDEEAGGVDRRTDPRRSVEQGAGLGEGGDHQGVPLGEHLVVESWPGTRPAGIEQRLTGCFDLRRPLPAAGPAADSIGDRTLLEVAGIGDVVELAHGRRISTDDSGHFVWSPRVEKSLVVVPVGPGGVGVLG